MLRQRTRNLQAAAALMDAVVTAAAFFLAYHVVGRYFETAFDMRRVLPLRRYLWLLFLSVPMWWALFAAFGGYDFSPLDGRRESLRRMMRPMFMGGLMLAGVAFFSKEQLFSRRVLGAFIVANVAGLAVGRMLVLTAAVRFHREVQARRILVVGTDATAREFGDRVRAAGWGLELAGYIAPSGRSTEADENFLGDVEALPRLLDGGNVDDVVIVDSAGDLATVQRVIQSCEEVGVTVHIPSGFFQSLLSRPHLESFGGTPMLTFTTRPYDPVALGIKRTVDIVLGILLLALLALPMIAIGLIVRFTSPGAAIFRQKRSGLYGRSFTMLKFRTMRVDAEDTRGDLDNANEMDGPVFKMRDDPRITGFGRTLRRYSLDELPQLWNVIKGDMSLIGPRPPLPDEVERYERWQRRRLSMRPGITCIWQVSDRNKATFEKWMEHDLQYIDNWSLWLDAKIFLKTIPAVFKGTGV